MADCNEQVTTTGEGDSVTSAKDAVKEAEKLSKEAAEALCPDECPPLRVKNTESATVKKIITEVPGVGGGKRITSWHATFTATYTCTSK